MTRAVLYARYSSDNQREASIEDQFRLCEEHAEREGWRIGERYFDAAISGSSMILRPSIQKLLSDAQRGMFDVVLAEALDRISRFACSAHVTNNSCTNSRTIARDDLETRVLAGLNDRMMTPQAAEAAMRSFAEETNRLNRECRSSGETAGAELVKVEKAMKEIVQAIEDGGYSRMLMDRLRDLEARQEALQERMAVTPEPLPDIHPKVAHICHRKVERLTEALAHPDDRREAAEALRGLIERVTLVPGPKRGQIDATLHGELGAILDWVERQAAGKAAKKNTPGAGLSGVSVSVVAGARNHLKLRFSAPSYELLAKLVASSESGLFRAAA